jgi:hypothetical protein
MVDFLFNKFAVSAKVVGTLGCLAWRHTNNGACCKMMESKLMELLVNLRAKENVWGLLFCYSIITVLK